MSKWGLLILLIVGTIYTVHGFSNLIGAGSEQLPVDLALRYHQAENLIGNQVNIYAESSHAQYPPSTLLLLSALFLPIDYYFIDESWAIICTSAILISIISLIDLSKNRQSGFFLAACFFAFHSIAQGLGVGQVTLPIVGALLGAIWCFERGNSTIYQIIGTFLLLFAMGKYSLLLPISMVLLLRKKYRPYLLAALALNIVISWALLRRVDSGIIDFVTTTLGSSGVTQSVGSIDLHALLYQVGITGNLPLLATLIMIVFLGTILIIRRAEMTIWDQLALAALVARFFVYHAHYDNLILIFVVIALFKRLPISFQPTNRVFIQLVLMLFSVIIPARFLTWEPPFYGFFLLYQLLLWWFLIFEFAFRTSNHSETNQVAAKFSNPHP